MEREKAALSFSLRPSHKQQPGFEYSISFLEFKEQDEDEKAKGLKTHLVFWQLRIFVPSACGLTAVNPIASPAAIAAFCFSFVFLPLSKNVVNFASSLPFTP